MRQIRSCDLSKSIHLFRSFFKLETVRLTQRTGNPHEKSIKPVKIDFEMSDLSIELIVAVFNRISFFVLKIINCGFADVHLLIQPVDSVIGSLTNIVVCW